MREMIKNNLSLGILIIYQVLFTGICLIQKSTNIFYTGNGLEIAKQSIAVQLLGCTFLLLLAEILIFGLFVKMRIQTGILLPLYVLIHYYMLYQTYLSSRLVSMIRCREILIGSAFLVVGLIFSSISVRHSLFGRKSILALIVAGILFEVFLLGTSGGFLVGGKQISDISKLFVLLILAAGYREIRASSLIRRLYFFLLVFCLIVFIKNVDFGNGMVFGCLTLMIIYQFSGLKKSIKAGLAMALFGPALFFIIRMLILTTERGTGILSHVESRLFTVFSVYNFSSEGNWEIQRNILSMLKGGILGNGLGDSMYAFLNDAAYTDLVPGVTAAVFGLPFLAMLLISIVLICLKLMSAGRKDEYAFISDTFANCVSSLILLQTIIALGANMTVLPFVGITTPFLSGSGLAMIENMFILGLALGTKVHDNKVTEAIYKGIRKISGKKPLIKMKGRRKNEEKMEY